MTEKENPIKFVVEQSKGVILSTESMFCLPKGYLKTQLALHLPQFGIGDIVEGKKFNRSLIKSECLRLGTQLKNKIQGLPKEFRNTVQAPKIKTKIIHEGGRIFELFSPGKKKEIKFSLVDPTVGQMIQLSVHYLSNLRTDTLHHYGLFRDGEIYPFSYAAVSFLDRNYILKSLPFEAKMKEIMVVTRLYSINNSPYNSTSLLLSLIRREIKSKYKNIKALVTAVNPNILFTGSSFKSSAFEVFALGPFIPLYYKGNYVTRKTISSMQLISGEKKYISKAKFKCLPIMWTVNVLDKKLVQQVKGYHVQKIPLGLYNKE